MNRYIYASVLVILAAFIFTGTLIYGFAIAPESEIMVPLPEASLLATSSEPLRLTIPSIGVDAGIQNVGITAKRTMATPTNYSDVGWYRYGPRPGDLGSAVIDGHVDNGFGLPAVLKRLSELKVGDDVYVQSRSGTRYHFVVADMKTYPYKDAPIDLIFKRIDGARLNLITCEGSWIPSAKTYNQRLVVYTKLVDSTEATP